MRKVTRILVVALAMLFAQAAIYAQTSGSLSGTVTDPQGAVIPGAKVIAHNNENGAERSTTTNESGVFSLAQLQPAVYTVSVEVAGFKKAVAADVKVSVSTDTTVNVPLELGTVGETVTVTSAQDVVNTTSASITNVINTKQVMDLPLAGRNPLELAALQAGIAVTGTNTRTANVGGLRGSSTNVTQDGINAMDNFVKTDSFFALSAPSLNSTAEFSITTGTVGPDAGRGAAQVNVVTRAGTNDYHGNLFYQTRNSAFEANDFFNNLSGTPRPDEHQHYFGGTIGGPVHFLRGGNGGSHFWSGKDKAWFFFSYEGFRENFQATRNRTVLSDTARTGVFRYTGTGTTGTQTVNLLSISTNVGTQFHTLNPLTSPLLNSMPQCNNFEVGDQLNICGYKYNVKGSDPYNKYVGRYDHQLTTNHKFEFVYNQAKFVITPDTFNALEAPFPGGVNAGQSSIRGLWTGALHSVLGQSSNEFRVGRQWAPVGFIRESQPGAPFLSFFTTTNIDNTFMSQGRKAVVDQVTDNFVMPHGEHTIKFGGDWQNIFAHTFNDAGINQTVQLNSNTANPTGITAASFQTGTSSTIINCAAGIFIDLVGLVGSASATYNVSSATSGFVPGYTRNRDFRERDLALFASDQWRYRPNVTLTYGVRWEYEGVPEEVNGLALQLTNFNDIYGVSGPGNLFNPNQPIPGTGGGNASGTAAPAKGTLDFVGKRGLFKKDWNNFAPFIGLAYSPRFKSGPLHMVFGGEGKSSIRLGYSISYLHDGFTVISNALGTGVTNPGLIASSNTANNLPVGVLGSASIVLPVPTFSMPLTDQQNFAKTPVNGLWAIDPKLRTPYVQQWNIGFEREIAKDTAFEVRYVGNHSIKMYRAYDINEINIFENGFLNEFKNAQINLAARGGGSNFAPGCVGCVATPMLDKFFAGLASTSGYSSSTFATNLAQNNVAAFANSLAFASTYRTNLRNNFASNFFVANPNSAFAVILDNSSYSNYHSLQAEVRRRMSNGLQFQANYTFAKTMADGGGISGVQSDLQNYRTLRNRRADYMRASFDQRHRFVANAVYDLPFGHGKQFLSGGGIMDRVFGGWTLGSIVTWQSRPPWHVSGGRSSLNCTPNRSSANQGCSTNFTPAQLAPGRTFEEFKSHTGGIYMTSVGPFGIDPAILCIVTTTNGSSCTADNGKFVSSSIKDGWFVAPAPGTAGNFPLLSINGPAYFNVDASLIKRIPLGERLKFELKTTFINILNHPNFQFASQTFDSTTFGRVTATSGGARVIHFQGTLSF